jgi:hypothetical protein
MREISAMLLMRYRGLAFLAAIGLQKKMSSQLRVLVDGATVFWLCS